MAQLANCLAVGSFDGSSLRCGGRCLDAGSSMELWRVIGRMLDESRAVSSRYFAAIAALLKVLSSLLFYVNQLSIPRTVNSGNIGIRQSYVVLRQISKT